MNVRAFAAAVAACVLLAAYAAFDPDAWMARRNDMADADRLSALHETALKLIATEGPTAQGIEATVESWPDGKPKIEMTARSGRYADGDDVVTALDVTVRMYTEKGELQGSMQAKCGTYDRRTRTGWLSGGAQVDFGAYAAKGGNIYFSLNDEFIKILSRPELRAKPGSLKLEKML